MDTPSLKRHEPLYLKHRPQALDQLVGQTAVLRTLTNAINNDRISHAYLFTGPRGTGKTSTARILAKSLNCKAFDKATVSPCLECASCLEIKQGNSPAVFEIDAASNNSVDDARVLIERAPLVAPGARYKVYIIDECHMLTKEAFNALLKTIEDPPPNVVFVLATTEEHKVIPTIVSRCQRLMFRLVTHEDLIGHLRNVADQERIEVTDRAIDFVARRSGGGLRDALGLLDQASLLSAPGQPVDVTDLLSLLGALHEDVLLQMSDHILNRRGHELLSAAASLLHEGREPAVVVQELSRHFLNLAKASYLSDTPDREASASSLIIGSPNYLSGLWEQAPKFERSELSQLVEALDRLEGTCRRTTQPAMHLEVGLLSLCHRQDMILIRELADRVAKLEQGAPAPRMVAPASVPVVSSSPAPKVEQPEPKVVEAPKAQQPQPQTQLQSQPQPQPAPKPIVSNDDADEADGSLPPDEVDRVWSGTLDELQRRNIPAFSVVSQHAFAHSLTEKELIVGIQKENMLKMVEAKLEHLKAACHAAVGQPLNIKLRVITTPARGSASTPAPAARPTPTPREPVAAASPPGAPGPDADDDYDGEPLAPRQKIDDLSSPTNASPAIASPSPATAADEATSDGAASSPRPPRGNDATIVKEAYKLFEGPGSRQLG